MYPVREKCEEFMKENSVEIERWMLDIETFLDMI